MKGPEVVKPHLLSVQINLVETKYILIVAQILFVEVNYAFLKKKTTITKMQAGAEWVPVYKPEEAKMSLNLGSLTRSCLRERSLDSD